MNTKFILPLIGLILGGVITSTYYEVRKAPLTIYSGDIFYVDGLNVTTESGDFFQFDSPTQVANFLENKTADSYREALTYEIEYVMEHMSVLTFNNKAAVLYAKNPYTKERIQVGLDTTEPDDHNNILYYLEKSER